MLVHAIYAGRTILEKLLRGWLFAFGKFTLGSVWLLDALIDHAGTSRMTAVFLFLLLIVVLSVLFCLACGFALKLRSKVATCLLLSAAMCTHEILISLPIWFSFPFLHIGYAFIDTPLASYAPIGGVWLVGYIALFSAAAIYFAFHKAFTPLLIAVCLWIASWPIGVMDWTQDRNELTVALVQANTSHSGLLDSQEILDVWDRHETLTESDTGADLYVWPETAIPSTISAFESRLDELARRLHGSLLLGIFERQGSGSLGRTFNSAVHVGGTTAIYRKQQLVPFGEYTPELWILTPLMQSIDYPTAHVSPGAASNGLLQTKNANAKVAICYEIAYPQLVNRAIGEADLIVSLTADAWFGESIGPQQQLQVARMRARETGKFLLRVSNVGPSAILGPDGSVLGILPTNSADTLRGTVHTRAGATMFSTLGLLPIGVILLFSFLTSLALLRSTQESSSS